jgi:NAD(P)H-hydrate epimerase
MGAGLLTVASEEEVLASLLRRLPEAILSPLSYEGDTLPLALQEAEAGKTAVLAGSGLGRSPAGKRAILSLIAKEGCPLVLDADALNLLAEEDVPAVLSRAGRQTVLTPHPMEFARLARLSVAEVQARRLPLAEEFARKTGAVLVLKGAGTVVTDGKMTYLNTTGSPALAKGGSGDVLAGAVLGLLAGGMPPLDAAALAVYLHGRAGDTLEEEYSDRGVLPSALGRQMAREIARLQREK